MKTIAFIDCETSGTDEAKDRLLEVGLVLWSVPHRAVIRSRSWLVKGATENAAIEVNGITPELAQLGYEIEDVDKQVHSILVKEASAVVAYNVDFDRKWFSRAVQECKPWLCGMDDFDYPRGGGGKKLVEVALAHGVGVVDAHRALTDCLTMARLFERVAELVGAFERDDNHGAHDNAFDAWLAKAARPRALFEVVQPNDVKDKAAELGFRWVKSDDGKKWLGMRKRLAIEDAKTMPFEVRRVA